MDIAKTKNALLLIVFFGGLVWWLHSGIDAVISRMGLEAVFAPLRGHGFFSVEGIVLWFLLLSVMVYPLVLWFSACAIALNPRQFRDFAFSRRALWLWFAPVSFTLALGCLLVYRVVVSVGVRIFWLWTLFMIAFGLVQMVVKRFGRK